MVRLAYIILSFVLLIIGILFAVFNAEPVSLNYYFGIQQLPLSLAIITALILGAILGFIATTGFILKLKRENARLKKMAELADREIKNLRSIPIKDKH